jgi:polyisoprenoid-binding protein YceI
MRHSGIMHLGTLLVASALAVAAHAETYSIDTAHTDITFKVRHMGISNVTGKFEKFGGTFEVDPKNVKATKGSMTIDVNSINTGNAKRDGHLKSEDFFDAAHHPEIKFVSKEVKDVNEKDSTATLVGDLTIRGVTKPVSLKIKGGGIINDGWGNERAAFTATGKINRFDYGLKWNKTVEAGGLVVAPDVDLNLAFEGVRKLTPAAVPAKAVESKPAAKPAK